MRAIPILFVMLFFSACNPERRTSAKIESLGKSGQDRKYEIGILCMEYILRDGDDLSYKKDLVRKLIDLGFFSEAVTAVESLVKTSPGDGGLFHLRSVAYRAQHQYDLAIADALRATRLEPENSVFSDALSSVRGEKELWDEVVLVSENLLQRPDSFPLLLQRAEKFFILKQYDAVLYDLGSASKMRSPADSIYYTGQVRTVYEGTRPPVEILRELLDYFRNLD